jgi:hypothetical protein
VNGSPPLTWIFISAAFVAGYYAWQSNFARLIPYMAVRRFHVTSTPTSGAESIIVVQIVPECLTDSPVNECRGHLLRVFARDDDKESWKETAMDEPLDLLWSIHDDSLPRTLNPGVSMRFNVCVIRLPGRVEFAGGSIPLRWNSVFRNNNSFRFDIRVTAKDCVPADISLMVKIRKDWSDPTVQIIRQETAVLPASKGDLSILRPSQG